MGCLLSRMIPVPLFGGGQTVRASSGDAHMSEAAFLSTSLRSFSCRSKYSFSPNVSEERTRELRISPEGDVCEVARSSAVHGGQQCMVRSRVNLADTVMRQTLGVVTNEVVILAFVLCTKPP